MPKYHSGSAVVDAEQYTEYGKLVKGMCNSVSCYSSGNKEPHVHSFGGQIVLLEVGDYVRRSRDCTFYYPQKPDVFEKTHYPVIK